MTPTEQVREEERRARERIRNLSKARSARRRQQREAEQAERRRRRERIRELRADERTLSRKYRSALAEARRLGQRVNWDDREAKAWDTVHAIGGRLRGIIATLRRMEAEDA